MAQPKPENNENIRGEPLDEDVFLSMATVDAIAIQSAIEWWQQVASPDWQDVLDKKPIGRNNG